MHVTHVQCTAERVTSHLCMHAVCACHSQSHTNCTLHTKCCTHCLHRPIKHNIVSTCALHSINSYETLIIIHYCSMHDGSGNKTHVTNVPLLSDLISATNIHCGSVDQQLSLSIHISRVYFMAVEALHTLTHMPFTKMVQQVHQACWCCM